MAQFHHGLLDMSNALVENKVEFFLLRIWLECFFVPPMVQFDRAGRTNHGGQLGFKIVKVKNALEYPLEPAKPLALA